MVVAPLVIWVVVVKSEANSMPVAMNRTEIVSRLRTRILRTMTYSHRFLLEQVQNADPVPTSAEQMLIATAGSDGERDWRQKTMLVAVLKVTLEASQDMDAIRHMELTSDTVGRVKNALFGKSVNYKFWNSADSEPFFEPITLQAAVAEWAVQADVALGANLDREGWLKLLNGPPAQHVLANYQALIDTMTDALDGFTEIIDEQDLSAGLLGNLLGFIMLALVVVCFAGTAIYRELGVKAAKQEVYSCLTALPKSIVNQLVEGLQVVRKDGATRSTSGLTEMSRQEDNIVKLFSNAEDASSSSAGMFERVISIVALMGLSAGVIFIFKANLSFMASTFIETAPHVGFAGCAGHFTYGAYYTLYHAMVCHRAQDPVLTDFYGTNHSLCTGGIYTVDELINKTRAMMTQSQRCMDSVRYGDAASRTPPFPWMDDILDTYEYCPERENPKPLVTWEEARRCLMWPNQFALFGTTMASLLSSWREGNPGAFRFGEEEVYSGIFHMITDPLQEKFLTPIRDSIRDNSSNMMLEGSMANSTIAIVLVCLGLIAEIVLYIDLLDAEAHIHSVLGLLLHAPS